MKNKVRFDERYAYMELTREDGKNLETVFNREDIFRVVDSGVGSWYGQWNDYSDTFYCRGVTPLIDGERSSIHLARFLMDTPEHLVVDHINFDGLDNRRENLRNVTTAENIRHSLRRLNVPHGKGYCYHKASGKWLARVQFRDYRSELLVETEAEAKEAISKLREDARAYLNAKILVDNCLHNNLIV